MKTMKQIIYGAGIVALLCATSLFAETATPSKAVAAALSGGKVGTVNFKSTVEQSKYGKQEQANFEALKKQMETVLEEKEKALNELSSKFNDPDYLDGLSQDAEKELKHKFRTINQEMSQMQNQYYQTLNQANMKILQKLNEFVQKAAQKVAKDNNLTMILNDDGGFYFASDLDYSSKIVAELDQMFDRDQKDSSKEPVKK